MTDDAFPVSHDAALEDEAVPPQPPQPRFSERRTHQCHYDGCDSPWEWQVFLHIRYGRRHVAIESLKSTIKVCDRHRRAANDYLLSEHNKREISTKLATIGRLSIDWDNAMVEFVPQGEQSWGPEQMVKLQVGAA